MWVAYAFVAIVVSCTNPGTDQKACRGEAVEGFTSREACEAAVGKIARLVEASKRTDIPVRIDAQCVAVRAPREA